MKFLISIVAFLAAAGAVGWILFGNDDSRIAEKTNQLLDSAPFTTDAPLPPITLATTTVRFGDNTEATFQLAEPFNVHVAAENLGKARFMAWSPDGRLFVPDLVDYELSHEGKLYILEDWNEETKRFDTTHTYLENLRGPNSVLFYTDADGQDWLYLALTAHLVRYPYTAGDTAPSGEPEIVYEFPNTISENATSVVWHLTRTLEEHDGRIYISVGSGCNACEHESGEMRGMIFSINPDGSDARVYAEGLRNAVGMTWAEDVLYATENGVDHLGNEAPDERLFRIEEGKHYGWPYCYEVDGERIGDTTWTWENPVVCDQVPKAFAAFPPRAAPLGVTYFEKANDMLDDTFLVALHGSFYAPTGSGYKIMRVSKEGDQEVFMDGFQLANSERVARPVAFLPHTENSFFFSDDHGGRIYYVTTN